MSERLIVALDFPRPSEARALVDALKGTISIYKIGLELLFNGGQELALELINEGYQVFIDAKFLDIGNTVKNATANVAALNASLLTIHATDRKTLDAAVEGRGQSSLKLLGVTVMTNLEASDLREQGINELDPVELVRHRALLAKDAGLDGVIASAHEASMIREIVGPDFLIITPGIRPMGSDVGDQSRIMTPLKAIQAGADYLVVGRPITAADDPAGAALAISNEIIAAAGQ